MCSPDVRNPNNTKQKKEESKERSAFRFAQGRSEYTKANVTKLVMLCCGTKISVKDFIRSYNNAI